MRLASLGPCSRGLPCSGCRLPAVGLLGASSGPERGSSISGARGTCCRGLAGQRAGQAAQRGLLLQAGHAVPQSPGQRSRLRRCRRSGLGQKAKQMHGHHGQQQQQQQQCLPHPCPALLIKDLAHLPATMQASAGLLGAHTQQHQQADPGLCCSVAVPGLARLQPATHACLAHPGSGRWLPWPPWLQPSRRLPCPAWPLPGPAATRCTGTAWVSGRLQHRWLNRQAPLELSSSCHV